MAVELHIYDGAAFRECTEVHIYDGASWRDCDEVHIYDGASWRQAFQKALVTLSGETVTDVSAIRVCRAGIRVNTDGTIDKREDSTYTQIDASTDWVIPNSAASGPKTYHVRVTNVSWTSGSSFDTSPGADGTWFEINTAREWAVFDTDSSSSGNKNVTFDLQISDDGGSTVLDTGSYTLQADYQTI